MSLMNGVEDAHAKIKEHLEVLEDRVQKEKMYWNQRNQILNHNLIHNFIEVQHNEIIHHLNQIKHHLQQINYHEQILVSITNANDPHSHITIPLKYWEKIMEDQNFINSTYFVKRRPKKHKEPEDAIQIPQIMVKNRVEQFEEMQKYKRVSSTMETFLEFNKMEQTFLPCEDNVEERKCYCDAKINKNISQGKLVKEINSGDLKVCGCSDKRNTSAEDETLCEDNQLEKNGGAANAEVTVSERSKDVNGDITGEETTDERNKHKPRIVEMHFKPLTSSPESLETAEPINFINSDVVVTAGKSI